MKAIQCCHPESPNFLEVEHLMPLITGYHLDRESLTVECTLAKRALKDKELESVNEVILEILPLRDVFPELFKLLQISLTITVSTAECERSFACLKRTKTYLRSTMSQQRLVNLAVLSIEKELSRELSRELSLDEVIDQFAAEDKNTRILLV